MYFHTTLGKLVGVQSRRETGFEMRQDQLLIALSDDGGECYWAVVIETCWSGVFWHWHDGGGLKAGRHKSTVQGQIEYLRQDACQLLSTCSEHTSRDTSP